MRRRRVPRQYLAGVAAKLCLDAIRLEQLELADDLIAIVTYLDRANALRA